MPATSIDALDADRFWREHYPALVRCAWLITGSRQDAEDAVHDAWVSCAGRLATVDLPLAYLRRAVVNACHGRHRRRMAEERAYRRVGEADVAVPGHLVEFHDALRGLDARSRSVVVLRLFCDMPDDEIATTLGCREVTVRVIFHRSMLKLREVLP
jgi:DNA-directed RNA polymerase specialized sigma24 family protein